MPYTIKVKLVAETNLSVHSDFFRSQFSWYQQDVLVLPFCVQERFLFDSSSIRKSKAVATGAVTFKITDNDFVRHFSTDNLQPQRKYLLEQDIFPPSVDVSIADWAGTEIESKSLIYHVFNNLKRNISSVIRSLKIDDSAPSSFYDLDLVKHYNSYEFVICPAELIGLPGIGAFEAMACGAV